MNLHDRRRREPADGGFTLVELMVTSALFMIVMAAAFAVLTRLTNVDRRAQNLANNQDDVRLALGQVARDLRSSNPFDPADSIGTRLTPNATTLRLALGAVGSQTYVEWRYDLTANQLVRSVLSSPTGTATSTTVVLANVSAPPGGTVFQYFCLSGAPLSPTSPTANTDLANFATRVRITVTAATTAGPAPFTAQQDVQLRNATGQGC